jgi:hypothetical protein
MGKMPHKAIKSLILLHKFFIESGLDSEAEFLKNAMSEYDVDFLKMLDESGRYDITRQDDVGKYNTQESYRYTPKGIEKWKEESTKLKDPDTGREFSGRPFRYDPEITDMDISEDQWGTNFKKRLKEGWLDQLPTNPELIYRGMSSEEYQYIQSTGKIQSLGDYNLGDEQIGLTYFSTNPNSAAHYAHGFAPTQYMATPNKPAYVIAIPKRESVYVAGTGESEVGVRGSIDASEIQEVWIGMPYWLTGEGSVDIINDWNGRRPGSRSAPSLSIAWKKIFPEENLSKTAYTLYHGTIADNKDSIERYGLEPQVGAWVQEVLSGATEDEIDYDKHGLVFAADKSRLDMAVYAMLYHIGNKLKKDPKDISETEIINHGL